MMTPRFSRTLLLTGVFALIAPLGCGAPPAREAEGLSPVRQALGSGPDFVVRKVSAPSSTWPGGPLPVTVTVCNQGADGDSTQVDVFLSSDPTVSSSDSLISNMFLGWLQPGRCVTDTYYSTAWVPDGAWHLGAIVDTYNSSVESDETNNTLTGPLVGVGYAPDISIPEVSVPASVMPGQQFTASVKLCNLGTTSGGGEVQLVLSEDPDIRFSYDGPPAEQDLPVFSFYADPLSAGQCRKQQVQISVQPPHPGAWYLGAVADPGHVLPELIRSNNTHPSELFGLGYEPDYRIRAVRGPASVTPGQQFTASVTMCNEGTASGGTDVQLVISDDTDIRFSYGGPPQDQDQPLTSFHTGTLAAGQCKTQQVQAYAQVQQQGAWYLGAVADPGNTKPELIENNNILASDAMGVGYEGDYTIEEVRGPASAVPGQPFMVSVKVCNQGTGGDGTQVQLVLSEDTEIYFSYSNPPWSQDEPLTSFYVAPLLPGQCKTEQVQVFASPPSYGAWYLGAVADPGESEPELIETNNSRASEVIGLGYERDFKIERVSVPSSVTPGQAFTASVRVCNDGTVSGSAEVMLVLSDDTDIRFSYNNPPYSQDWPIQSFDSGPLSPGQCRTQQVQTSVYPPQHGGWYVGAVADPGDTQEELIEINNTLASALMGVGYEADYSIRDVSGPASIMPGQQFTASVTVCNDGTVSGNTEVQLVLSEDSDIRFSYGGFPESQDFPLASFSLNNPLQPGQCKTQQVQAVAQVPREGAWYLGAVADPGHNQSELNEDNNSGASEEIGIGYLADHVIREVSGPASVTPGQQFTASVTVCNDGTVSGGTEVLLVLSEDTDIRYSYGGPPYGQDVMLGSIYTQLAPGQCKTEQVQAIAQVWLEGPWYLGAIADPGLNAPELIETNNARASKPMGVGYRPDQVIRRVSAPASITPGQPFMASVTICNEGTMAGSTNVQLVLSEDTDLRFSNSAPPGSQDLPLGSFFVGSLQPGQCRTEQVQTSVWPFQDGAWYIGAIADPDNYEVELQETNNTGISDAMGIGYKPNYRIAVVSGPRSVRPGDPFTASVNVCNDGTVSGNTEVMLVLSEDTDIRFSYSNPPYAQDLPLGSFSTGLLAAGQCTTQQVQTSAWVPQHGAWYLGAVADPGGYELEFFEDDNSLAAAPMGVGYEADFEIRAVSGPASVIPGQAFTASVTVCNEGTEGAPVEVMLVLSKDANIRFSYSGPYEDDMPVTSFYTSGVLEPGQCRTEQVQTSVWVPQHGAWYLGAVADPGGYTQEFFENNNSLAATPMGVGYETDFEIQAVSGPASVTPGQPFTASVTVCNDGTVSGGTEVQLVLSEDADIHFSYSGPPYEQDQPLQSFYTGTLNPGQCRTQQVQASAWVPQHGAWYLGAVADPGGYQPEFFENNNSLAATPMGIGYETDFEIQAVSGSPSVRPGDPLIVDVTVCNKGTVGGSTEVLLVLSEDTDIHFSYNGPPSSQDLLLSSFWTGPLEAGQCMTQQVQSFAWSPHDGVWYVGALADPNGYELEFFENNNTLASAGLGIGHETDYRIQTVSGPPSARPGDPFTVDVTVCNDGTIGGNTEVMLVLSEDTDIRFSYSGPASAQDLPLGSFFTGPLPAGQCLTQQVQVSAWAPHNGGWYVGAVVDPGRNEQEFFENNNARAGTLMGIGYDSDLTIETLTAPGSVTMGQPYEVTVKVCNQGFTSIPAEVQLVLSEDSDIRFSYNGPFDQQDLPVESLSFSNLNPGECATQNVTVSMTFPNASSWYVGGVADPGQYQPELIENNNARASGLVSLQP